MAIGHAEMRSLSSRWSRGGGDPVLTLRVERVQSRSSALDSAFAGMNEIAGTVRAYKIARVLCPAPGEPVSLFPFPRREWSAGKRQGFARPLMGGSLAIGPPRAPVSKAGLRGPPPGARATCRQVCEACRPDAAPLGAPPPNGLVAPPGWQRPLSGRRPGCSDPPPSRRQREKSRTMAGYIPVGIVVKYGKDNPRRAD
jgi:hypothetical protein